MGLKSINFRFFRFLLLLLLFSLIAAQSSIPSEQDGFWYGERSGKEESVFIEAFFDPVCPDSRDSWPPLKKALQKYGSRAKLVVHTFPLPYHDNAFTVSWALHIIKKLNSSATCPLLEAFFENQAK